MDGTTPTQSTDFAPPDFSEIMADLYASKINGAVGWLWDTGFFVALGTALDRDDDYDAKGVVATLAEAAAWLRTEAIRRYPDSAFARKHASPSE